MLSNGQAIEMKSMWGIKMEPLLFGMPQKLFLFVIYYFLKFFLFLCEYICWKDVLKAHECDITHMQWFEKDRLLMTSAKEKCIKVCYFC